MRKILRDIIRSNAERGGYKPSKAVKSEWDKFQIKRIGATARKINQAKATHKKRTWTSRINAEIEA